MGKNKVTTSHNPKGKEEQDSISNLWKQHGIEDVYFQRATIVTFLSILGGVAVGALLTQFIPMVEQVRDSRWQLLLFFAASINILFNNWIMLSWGTLVLKWSLSIPLLIPQLLACLCTCIMCLFLTNPSGWMASVGTMFIFTLLIQFILMKTGRWENYSPQNVKGIKTYLMIYFIWMIMAFLASAHLYFYPSKINEIIWGVIALLSSIAGLVLQHQGMEREKKEFGIP